MHENVNSSSDDGWLSGAEIPLDDTPLICIGHRDETPLDSIPPDCTGLLAGPQGLQPAFMQLIGVFGMGFQSHVTCTENHNDVIT